MLIDLLTEVEQSHSHFVSELEAITDKPLIRQRMQTYKMYLKQFMALKEEYGTEAKPFKKSFHDAEIQVNDSTIDINGDVNIDFDKFLQERMAEGEKEVLVNDFEELKNSTRKSMDFLIQKAGMKIESGISSISKINDDSPYSKLDFSMDEPKKRVNMDTEASYNNYEMTDLSMLDSSFNVTHEYCYKDARGNIVSSENKEANSFDKFLKCEKMVMRNNSSSKVNNDSRKYLYCNDKRIPDWAMDMNLVSDQVTKQKVEGLHRRTFGIFRGVTNLDLEEVLGVKNEAYKRRGDSVFGVMSESTDNAKKRVGTILKLADINFDVLK